MAAVRRLFWANFAAKPKKAFALTSTLGLARTRLDDHSSETSRQVTSSRGRRVTACSNKDLAYRRPVPTTSNGTTTPTSQNRDTALSTCRPSTPTEPCTGFLGKGPVRRCGAARSLWTCLVRAVICFSGFVGSYVLYERPSKGLVGPDDHRPTKATAGSVVWPNFLAALDGGAIAGGRITAVPKDHHATWRPARRISNRTPALVWVCEDVRAVIQPSGTIRTLND